MFKNFFYQPFIEGPSLLHNFFLPPIYAIAIPATLLVIAIILISVFVAIVLIKESKKKKIS